ncbi:MAG: SAM-dependent methyltransferase, partial [Ilumatobacteraceae bacterium]
DDHRLVNAYKRFLEWDIEKQPRSVKAVEKVLSPLMGKSLIVYAIKMPSAREDRDVKVAA